MVCQSKIWQLCKKLKAEGAVKNDVKKDKDAIIKILDYYPKIVVLKMDFEKYINGAILNKFEFYNYGHALEILHDAFPLEWYELQECLCRLKLTLDDIRTTGGNESPIPKKFDEVLYPYGWREIRISGDLVIKKYPRQAAQRRGRFANEPYEVETIEGYIDGHNIDFLKNKVAFDLE